MLDSLPLVAPIAVDSFYVCSPPPAHPLRARATTGRPSCRQSWFRPDRSSKSSLVAGRYQCSSKVEYECHTRLRTCLSLPTAQRAHSHRW